MKGERGNGAFLARLAAESRILSRLSSDNRGKPGASGFTLREDDLLGKGLLGTVGAKADRAFSAVKRACASATESSRIISAFRRAAVGLLDTSVGSIGVFLLFFGLYSAAVYLIRQYAGEHPDIFDPVFSAVVALAGLLLTPVKKSLLGCIKGSLLPSYMTGEIFSVSDFALEREHSPVRRTMSAVLLGSVTGALCFLVSPADILLFIIFTATVSVVLYSPEGGLVFAAFLLPFAGDAAAAVLAVSAAGYLFKLLRGKRNLYIGTADLFVILCAGFVIVSGLCSPFPDVSLAGHCLCAAAGYFLASNLIRTSAQLKRLYGALCSGGLIAALAFIIGRCFPDGLAFTGISAGALSGFAPFLPLLLPAAACLASREESGASHTLTFALILAGTVASVSEGQYLAAICCLAVYGLIAMRRPMLAMLTASFAAVSVVFLFAFGIIPGSMFTLPVYGESLTALISGYFYTGIGIGGLSARLAPAAGIVTDTYTGILLTGGILTAVTFAAAEMFLLRRAIVAALNCGSDLKKPVGAAASMLILFAAGGVFVNFFSNPVIAAVFAVICGCASALPRICDRETGGFVYEDQ